MDEGSRPTATSAHCVGPHLDLPVVSVDKLDGLAVCCWGVYQSNGTIYESVAALRYIVVHKLHVASGHLEWDVCAEWLSESDSHKRPTVLKVGFGCACFIGARSTVSNECWSAIWMFEIDILAVIVRDKRIERKEVPDSFHADLYGWRLDSDHARRLRHNFCAALGCYLRETGWLKLCGAGYIQTHKRLPNCDGAFAYHSWYNREIRRSNSLHTTFCWGGYL